MGRPASPEAAAAFAALADEEHAEHTNEHEWWQRVQSCPGRPRRRLKTRIDGVNGGAGIEVTVVRAPRWEAGLRDRR